MRQRDIPREVVIAGNFWQIKFCRLIPGHPKRVLGICDPSDKTIYIRQGQGYLERLNTLVHELTHAFEYEYGHRFKLKHSLVDKIAGHAARFMIDNF